MAHFAQLNANNEVLRVVVISNDVLVDKNGVEQEELGRKFCSELYGGRWIQTSYNKSMRENYAGVGSVYVQEKDAFSSPRPPFKSWILNKETLNWDPPIPKPNANCFWDENNLKWVIIGEQNENT